MSARDAANSRNLPVVKDELDGDPVGHAFRQVLDRWDDEQAHASFLGLCTKERSLGEAARLYREVIALADERKSVAEAQLSAVTLLAEQMMSAERTPRRRPSRLRWLLLGVGLASLTWAVFSVLHRR